MSETLHVIPKVNKPKNITNSKGLLTGFLNLTIDKAPTKPNDRAKEDLTIDMTKVVIMTNNIKLYAIIFLLDMTLAYFINTFAKTNPRTVDISKLMIKPEIGILVFVVAIISSKILNVSIL